MKFLTAVAEWMKPRAKAVAAASGTLITLFYGLQQDGGMSGDDWMTLVGAVLTAAGLTYAIPNLPAGSTPKRGQQ